MTDLTRDRLKELLHYDPATGVFTWINSPRKGWNGRNVGSIHTSRRGVTSYLRTRIDGKHYLLHRLAWLYENGSFPDMLDHIDGNGLNNSIANIRESTAQQNNRNVTHRSKNISGQKNVHLNKKTGNWVVCFRVRLTVGGFKKLNFGTFVDLAEAAEVARDKRIELHGEFARHE